MSLLRSVRPLLTNSSIRPVHHARNLSVSTKRMQEEKSKTKSNKPSNAFYNEEQINLMSTVKKIIEKDVNPFVDEWEKAGIFPAHEVFKKFGDAGLLGINKPTEYGGLGLGFKYGFAFLEALGTVHCGSIPMAVAVQSDMATPALTWFGSDSLKREFLVPAISGEQVACLGVSEPQAGSDVAGIKTSAKRVGDDLIVNGSKMWITNGVQADWMCCLVNTSQNDNLHANKSLVIIPMKTPGVKIGRSLDKLGMRSSDTAEIFFEDVRVPATNVIGEAGKGFMYQMMQFQEERLAASAISISPLVFLIEDTSRYCHSRMVYGAPLINNQSIHFRLAELLTDVEALRALTYRAVDLYMGGENVTTLASMSKLKVGRLSREVTDSCLQYWGGMGFTNDVLVSRFYRDMRIGSIGGGADEVMLSIIAKSMGNLPSAKPRK